MTRHSTADGAWVSEDVQAYQRELATAKQQLADEVARVGGIRAALEQDIRAGRALLDETESDYQRQLEKLTAQLSALSPVNGAATDK